MSLPFNPFHKWLGLAPQDKNPNHFRLLGVNPKLTDSDEIKKAVDDRVRSRLVLLSKIPAGKHDELVQKLKHRIAIARKTLLDPQARASYLEALNQRAKTQASANPAKVAKSPSTKPPSVKPSIVASNSDLNPPAVKPAQPKAPIAPAPASPEPSRPIPARAVSPSVNAPIPMAVPLATNVSASAPAAIVNDEEEQSLGAINIDHKISRKRKKSPAGILFGLGMLAATIFGGYLIYDNFDALKKVTEVAEVDPQGAAPIEGVVESSGGSSSAAPKRTATPVRSKTKSFPKIDLNNLPELNIAEVVNHEQTKNRAFADNGFADKTPSGADKKMMSEPDGATEPVARANPVNMVSLDEFQISKCRRHLERARRSLYRREKSVASKSAQAALEILNQVRKGPTDVFVAEQEPVAKLASATKEACGLVEGFWNQVIKSTNQQSGGQEIEASGSIIGLLEADQEKFTVRMAGANVTYEYHFCPPNLAIELAKMGDIGDIPTWNKQLATFYVVNQVDGKRFDAEINALLRESEAAGHDCDGIRHFAEFEFGSIGKPDTKIEMPDQRTLEESIAEFRTENEITSINSLDPGMAGKLAELLLQIDSPNFQQHVAYLEEARNLAIRGGNASQVEDAIIELDNFARVDRAELMGDSLIALSKSKLTSGQSRTLMERAIPFLISSSSSPVPPKSREKLASQLKKLAEAHEMVDSKNRLNQLAEKEQ